MSGSLYPEDMFGGSTAPAPAGALEAKFGEPPVSVLDARTGRWQERKRAWLALGIKSEVGRDGNLLKMSDTILRAQAGGDAFGDSEAGEGGTSIFDPALCETLYRWYCPPGGQIIDPFAGGSVRGIVASWLGYQYWGGELRAEQVEANRAQANAICLPGERPQPQWVCGDSRDTIPELKPHAADFLFSCPPYGDLERYSDDERDLSTYEWPQFLAAYREIIQKAVSRLAHCRFAAFVVGDFRNRRGLLSSFPHETVRAFELGGMQYYARYVLVTSMGSAALRAAKMFESGRKPCPSHQDVLVFVKGDHEQAAARCRGEAESRFGRIKV